MSDEAPDTVRDPDAIVRSLCRGHDRIVEMPPSNPHRGHHPGAPRDTLHEMAAALAPLANIADQYDASELDEARPDWMQAVEWRPEHVELYAGRGGRRLLTLADCFRARDVLRRFNPAKPSVRGSTYDNGSTG